MFATTLLPAQDVSFKAVAPNVVEVGEQFRISYTLNKEGENLKVPTFEGFNLLMGPSTSTSSSFSNVNGRVTQSQSYTYTYILQSNEKGVKTIPAATIEVDGKTYTSNVLSIEVVASSGNKSSGTTSQGTVQPEKNAAISDKNLFVLIDVSRSNLYIGEAAIVTLKVYTKVDLVNLGQTKFPSFSGFLVEEVPTPQQISLNRENYNGSVYNVGVLRKYLLFPQHTGEIVIEPFELECVVRQQLSRSRSFFDDFFGNYQDVRVKRVSKPVTINVNELPIAGKPAVFSGTVGRINMTTSISADTVNVNEAITYKVTFSGSGNIKLIETPSISFPPDFENYEPKINKNIKTDENGMHGSVTYEYLLIPRYAGDYTIPGLRFAYFDTQTKTYKTLNGNSYSVNVRKVDGVSETQAGNTTSGAVVQSFKKEDVKFLGEDIRYIKTGNLHIHDKGIEFFKTLTYWLLLVVPLLLFVVGSIINRRRIKANADLIRVKNKAATKMARKRMKLAAVALKSRNSEIFYDEVLKALWGYVSYKLNVDRSELNRDNISEKLDKKSVDVGLIDAFIALLDECEFARYAPGGDTEQKMDDTYKKGIAIITKLDRAVK
jgi:hypothetical protein